MMTEANVESLKKKRKNEKYLYPIVISVVSHQVKYLKQQIGIRMNDNEREKTLSTRISNPDPLSMAMTDDQIYEIKIQVQQQINETFIRLEMLLLVHFHCSFIW